MRVLVIGGDGMLGHQLFSGLSAEHEVRATLHGQIGQYQDLPMFGEHNAYPEVDVCRPGRLTDILAEFRPDAICNAAGLVKQRAASGDAIANIETNALFPHRLAVMAKKVGARVVQVSTDCVFAGIRGGYSEDDLPDPLDLYGRSKLLGELAQPGCVTLRASMIGLELRNKQGLVEWALAQRGEIQGYRRAIFSGLTTYELARVCEALLTRHRDLVGIWHVASKPISKYQLLRELFLRLGRTDVVVVPDDALAYDRTLMAGKFEKVTGYRCPGWDEMLDELCGAIRARKDDGD